MQSTSFFVLICFGFVALKDFVKRKFSKQCDVCGCVDLAKLERVNFYIHCCLFGIVICFAIFDDADYAYFGLVFMIITIYYRFIKHKKHVCEVKKVKIDECGQ